MQYKVPQNIDMEDKIIGPFTMKQFIYLLISGGIIYGWWNFVNQFKNYQPLPPFLVLAIPVGLLGICLALVKINDRPFEVFLINVLRFLFVPKRRMWQRGFQAEDTIVMDKTDNVPPPRAQRDERSLDDLAKALDKESKNVEEQAAPARAAAAMKMKAAQAKAPKADQPSAEKPEINLSVKDVNSAAQKQAEAQKTPTQSKKGLLGFLRR